MRPADVSYQNFDIDRAWWYGWSPTPERQGAYTPEDNQLFITPTNEPEPDGVEPYWPFWVAGNCPPWNCPTFWGYPFDLDYEICLNEYEVETYIGSIQVPAMAMQVIRGLSYEVLTGLSQYEIFEITLRRGKETRVVVEDMIIDPTAAAPAERYVFAGDTRPLDIRDFADRERTYEIYVKARGIVDWDGVSVHAPGDPLIPSAHIRISLMGWVSPIRQNVDGGPRPADLGDMLFIPLDERLAVEGMSDPWPGTNGSSTGFGVGRGFVR